MIARPWCCTIQGLNELYGSTSMQKYSDHSCARKSLEGGELLWPCYATNFDSRSLPWFKVLLQRRIHLLSTPVPQLVLRTFAALLCHQLRNPFAPMAPGPAQGQTKDRLRSPPAPQSMLRIFVVLQC